jgi:predicted secreted protein
MARSAGRVALARLAASLVLLLAFFGTPGLAGDRAGLNVLGYSKDLRYFAFEEFGVRDGSGGNYSHIFVVDLSDDSWVDGTPFLTDQAGDTDDVAPKLDAIRAKTAGLAAATLTSLKISVPATTLVLLGDGVPEADGKTMSAAFPSCCGSNDTDASVAVSLALTTFASKSAAPCSVDTALGYALTATYADGSSHELHRDGDTLPKSRSCPKDYRLYAIVAPFEAFQPRVAIISSYPFDFEGVSRRFLAVPIDGL